MRRLIIAFDFDGTLVDCKLKQMVVLKAAATACGLSISNNIWYKKRLGATNIEAIKQCGISEYAADIIQKLWIHSIENPIFSSLDNCFDDIVKYLEIGKRRGDIQIVISSRQNAWLLTQQMMKLGLVKYIDKIVVVRPGGSASKEKEKQLRKYKVTHFYGDSEHDYQAAKRYGSVKFFWLSCGQRSAKFITKFNCKAYEKISHVSTQAMRKNRK